MTIERPRCIRVRPHEGGCEREIRQRTPCIGERNSRAPPIKRRRGKRKEEGREGGGDGREGGRGGRGGGDGGGDGLDTHFQSLFVVTDPSAPESTVDSYLVVPIFMIFHCTAPHLALEFIPRRTWSKRAPRSLVRLLAKPNHDLRYLNCRRRLYCPADTVGRNIFLRRDANWRLIRSGVFR